MSIRLRLRFDGKVFVPFERVQLDKNQIVNAEISVPDEQGKGGEAWRSALDDLKSRGISGVCLPANALRRDAIYPDRV